MSPKFCLQVDQETTTLCGIITRVIVKQNEPLEENSVPELFLIGKSMLISQ
jgi:hypothetical protein